MVPSPPVGVDTVKLDADTPVTVPTEPPAAFVDRALDPPPERGSPVKLCEPAAGATAVDAALVVVAAVELDEPPHAASPTAKIGTINPTANPRVRLRIRR